VAAPAKDVKKSVPVKKTGPVKKVAKKKSAPAPATTAATPTE
jgi:hypothetical protein